MLIDGPAMGRGWPIVTLECGNQTLLEICEEGLVGHRSIDNERLDHRRAAMKAMVSHVPYGTRGTVRFRVGA
jgi:hypothetical protein